MTGNHMTDKNLDLTTPRLVLRAPVMEDLDALVERRNDPAVAKYQDWPLPFERDAAEKLLTGAIAMGGPTRSEWWMTTVVGREHPENPPMGDIAIHLSPDGYEAEIGYTFAVVNHGNGYATEAVAAVLDHLFDDLGIRRVSASLHPDNVSSARVLERNGFLYEGRTRGSYWRGQGADAVFSDALFYGLTEADHRDWRARPAGPPDSVELVEVTVDNYYQVAKLASHKSQEELVSPVEHSYSDAYFPELVNDAPVVPWMRAIQADGEFAGFVMVAWRSEHHPNPYLWRLLIDRAHQRRGIGTLALDLVEDECRANGDTKIEVSWSEAKGSPAPFYEARGYVRTGRLVDGETEAIKPLT